MTYTVFDCGSFVYACAGGVLTEMAFLDHQRALIADPDVRPRYRHLLDARPVTPHPIDAARLLRGLECLHKSEAQVKWSRCAVVAHDYGWFDVAFQQECERHGLTLIAFNDPAIACLWLGADYARLTPKTSTQAATLALGRRFGE